MRFREAVQDPVVLRSFHAWATIAWIVMIPVALVTGWVNSVTFISALSLWALVTGHWSAWQAARAEVRQEELAPEGNLPGPADQ